MVLLKMLGDKDTSFVPKVNISFALGPDSPLTNYKDSIKILHTHRIEMNSNQSSMMTIMQYKLEWNAQSSNSRVENPGFVNPYSDEI